MPAMRKKKGEVQTAQRTGSLRTCTTYLTREKMIEPKMPDAIGAMQRPAKMAPNPDPLFQPHCTLLAPTAATPTPAMEETRE